MSVKQLVGERAIRKTIIEQIKQIIPPLDGRLHKGQSGRVGVLGGALYYTGAPYFAAISALRLGADLSHVICSPTAAGAIKSYSPDLIVHPILRQDIPPEKTQAELEEILSKLHAVVIGPGLGRESYMLAYFRLALLLARARGIFLVLDADALWAVCEDLSIIRGYRRAVLTPNLVEFKRLCDAVGVHSDTEEGQKAAMVSKALGGVTVLQKGANDIIAVDTTGETNLELSKIEGSAEVEQAREIVKVDIPGGLKRCGGQGDVLSGAVGTMLAWGKCYEDGAFGDKSIPASRIPILAAVGGSMATRTASRRAFKKEGRAVVTADIIPEVGQAFAEVFGDGGQDRNQRKL